MRLIVNTTNLKTGGALQVACSLLQEWAALFPERAICVLLSRELAAVIDPQTFPAAFRFEIFDHHPSDSWWRALTMRSQLTRIARQWQADVVFTVFGPALWRPELPHVAGFANGYYLFDNCRFIRDHVKTDLLQRFRYYLRRALLLRQLRKEADHYWVETDYAQQRLCKELHIAPAKVSVIGNTFGSWAASVERITRGQPHSPFRLLYLTAYYPHKNIEVIPRVIDELVRKGVQVQFVLTLPQDRFDQIFTTPIQKAYTLNLGPQSPAVLASVYRDADAAFIPTLMETFSAAFPEAMKMQVPVLCSDIPAARSVCGEAASYFNPYDPVDIADKIQVLAADPALCQAYIEAGLQQLSHGETPRSRAVKLMTLLEQRVQ